MATTLPSESVRSARRGAALLKALRQIHLYLGVFCAPALVFFAVTGVLQTFSLHQASRTSDYKPPQWLAVAAQIHKNQNMQLRKPPPPAAKASGPPADKAEKHTPAPGPVGQQAPQHNALPEKIFFAIVGFSFLSSVLTGVYMAYKYNRGKWTVTALLLAGLIVPVVLLFV